MSMSINDIIKIEEIEKRNSKSITKEEVKIISARINELNELASMNPIFKNEADKLKVFLTSSSIAV